MITVAGEALIDLVIDASGSVAAVPGGAGLNVARTIARLGGDCRYLGKLSDDGFGDQLRCSLEEAGVRIAVPDPTPAPTTLAIARLDPNCRPAAVTDLPAYREMIDTVVRQVDVVKVSTDDLGLLRPHQPWLAAARGLLDLGPAAVLVTDGPSPATVLTESYERSIPVPAVEVVDTIGAGDAFVAGFLTWWTAHALNQHDAGDPEALLGAATAAIEVAAADCTVRGANLPAEFRWSTKPGGSAVGAL